MDVLCEDVIMKFTVLDHGTASYMPDIRPGVYRRHQDGLWTGGMSINKNLHMTQTYYRTLAVLDDTKLRIRVCDRLTQSVCSVIMKMASENDHRLPRTIWRHIQQAFEQEEIKRLLFDFGFLKCVCSAIIQQIKKR